MEDATKRFSLTTSNFLKRSKSTASRSEPRSFGDSFSSRGGCSITCWFVVFFEVLSDSLACWFFHSLIAMEVSVAEFEANLESFQDIYPDMDREVLKDILSKAGGELAKAIDVYTAQSISL